jgi:hypothetical protein
MGTGSQRRAGRRGVDAGPLNRRARSALLALPVLLAFVAGCASAVTSSAPPADTAAPGTTQAPTTTRKPVDPNEDFVAEAKDFINLHDMTPVRGFYLDNRIGHLDEAIAVANNPDGGVYPVGTIIQLVPQEAMVKRKAGFDPQSMDWEFFELQATPEGTVIGKRGGSEIVNRFGGSCADCHKKARPQFDFVCEDTHGCDLLPVPHEVFVGLQEADPRPRVAK